MPQSELITSDLENIFKSLRRQDPLKIKSEKVPYSPDYKEIPNQNYPTPSNAFVKQASVSPSGTIYSQPAFFSPIHTPINWQIPSKRIEQYSWARFFYTNEPKVGAAIDFYSQFPINDWDHECKNIKIKKHFDRLKKRLKLIKWCKYISHELHLLGDCFVLVEISCDHCNGTGKINDIICDHEDGTVKRILILNPDFVDVYSSPIDPEPMISFRPDEVLMSMVSRKDPGYEKLSPEVANKIASGQPILLDNRNVSHLKYGESGYQTYGIGMIRRLFPILSYKTKLMVAQWIVAERLIIPIKVIKVGDADRPAGPADIAAVQQQFAQTANDPNTAIVVHHAFSIEYFGASGSVLTLSNEFDFINAEILDGLMINNALLNGEGPNFSSAAVGIEAMIQRLDSFRNSISDWIEEFIYLPEAERQGFLDEDDEVEGEYIYPKIKWRPMNLRDKNQDKSYAIQLYDKGILSSQTLLEEFGYDPDVETERKRFDAIQMMTVGQDQGANMSGGMGGMGGIGGIGGMGEGIGGIGGVDLGSLGGEGNENAMGSEPPISPAVNDNISKSKELTNLTANVANEGNFKGKVLKKKTRDKIQREKQRTYIQQEKIKDLSQQKTDSGWNRDANGRIVYTKPERILIGRLQQYQKDGIIKYPIKTQHVVEVHGKKYPMDFAIVSIKLCIEVDGISFHQENPTQLKKDKERDMGLNQLGWTVVRFTDEDVEKRLELVIKTIVKTIMQKEILIKNMQSKENE